MHEKNELGAIEQAYADLLRGTQQVSEPEIADAERLWRESVDPRYANLLDAVEVAVEAAETDNS